ncbi:metal-sulfur cluster assembly factor [Candidatus Micrarchaeota archaeon]|nr:metal-sulfur cluster assembly factor [Candidatus Micrarchaeota archaeon]
MVTKDEILSKLREVEDPELGMNIVDLGLIYEVDIKDKVESNPQKVFIRMTFTTPACPMINEMLHEIQSRLDELPELDIEVSVVFDPLWNPDMMTDRAKIRLGLI